jgi:hypothetical protein
MGGMRDMDHQLCRHSRTFCVPEYLVLCQLLAHGPASLDLNEPSYRVRQEFPDPRGNQILARAPCPLSRTRILIPVFAPNVPLVPSVGLAS